LEKNALKTAYSLLMIGGSAGSLEVVLKIVPRLKKNHLPIVFVLHRKNSNDSILRDLLSSKTLSKVYELEDKQAIEPGHIYLAPPDYHLLFEKQLHCSLDNSEKVNFSRPSIDVAFDSASRVYGPGLVCILLSGANADGMEGMKKVKEKGGTLVVQNPETAAVAYMPQQALLNCSVDAVLNPDEMAVFINDLEFSAFT
jgi:two-component system chemotaxis response regulator CheB